MHVTMAQLEAGLDHVRQSPTEEGTLDLIVARPGPGKRIVLEEGELDLEVGLVGNDWHKRKRRNGPPDPLAQLNIMNFRAAALVAGSTDRIPLAGDQLYVDFDLSTQHLDAGTRLAIGDAVIEITPKPHRGCAKFTQRFGDDATRFFNTGIGIALNLRGRNAKVVQPGTIHRGDSVKRLSST
jgi:MOSC domain-containing protein YiiM